MGNDRPEVLDAISKPDENDDCDAYAPYILLKFDARVVRNENIESGIDGGSKQDAVPKPEPTLGANSGRLMAGQFCRKVARQALINENSHPRSLPPLRVPGRPPPAPS